MFSVIPVDDSDESCEEEDRALFRKLIDPMNHIAAARASFLAYHRASAPSLDSKQGVGAVTDAIDAVSQRLASMEDQLIRMDARSKKKRMPSPRAVPALKKKKNVLPPQPTNNAVDAENALENASNQSNPVADLSGQVSASLGVPDDVFLRMAKSSRKERSSRNLLKAEQPEQPEEPLN